MPERNSSTVVDTFMLPSGGRRFSAISCWPTLRLKCSGVSAQCFRSSFCVSSCYNHLPFWLVIGVQSHWKKWFFACKVCPPSSQPGLSQRFLEPASRTIGRMAVFSSSPLHTLWDCPLPLSPGASYPPQPMSHFSQPGSRKPRWDCVGCGFP